MSERTSRHWFLNFRSGNLSFCDEDDIGWLQILDDEAPMAAIEENKSEACGESAKRFQISDERIRLYLHRKGKAYKLSKWVSYTPLEGNKQQ